MDITWRKNILYGIDSSFGMRIPILEMNDNGMVALIADNFILFDGDCLIEIGKAVKAKELTLNKNKEL